MKGKRLACSSFVVSACLTAASFFSIEAMSPQPVYAASVHLQCRMISTGGKTRQIKFTFNEAKKNVTIISESGTIRKFNNAFITHSQIMVSHKVNGVPFDLKVNRITGKAVRTRRGVEVASGHCSKTKKIKRKFWLDHLEVIWPCSRATGIMHTLNWELVPLWRRTQEQIWEQTPTPIDSWSECYPDRSQTTT